MLQVVSVEKRHAGPTSDLDTQDTEMDDAGVNLNGGSRRKRTRTRQGWEWTIGSMRREHTHDVLALAIHDQSLDDSKAENRGVGSARKGPVLVSAGMDSSLSLYSVPGFKTQASDQEYMSTGTAEFLVCRWFVSCHGAGLLQPHQLPARVLLSARIDVANCWLVRERYVLFRIGGTRIVGVASILAYDSV